MSKEVDFQNQGIAEVIKENRLRVPVNQRSYKWEDEHVRDLFTDLENALQEQEYFLGTMVCTRCADHELEIADGQQRLATTVILLAAFRDYLYTDTSQSQLVDSIRTDYLASWDMELDDVRPHLTLNNEDNDYFQKLIISDPDNIRRTSAIPANKPSHVRISRAATIAREWVLKIVNTQDASQRIHRIKDWIRFLLNSAKVILVVVPDPGKAFRIFETLNDRGLRLSQVDLLKNHLYGLAATANRLTEVKQRWDEMVGAMESAGFEDYALDYIRQFWISRQGYIKEVDLYQAMKDYTKSPQAAIDFASEISSQAGTFAALLNSSHPLWSEHTESTRRCLRILTDFLKVDRIRPLLLSAVSVFDKKATEKTFRLCVSWTVRFLIVGGIGSGTIEKFYADMACKVHNKVIKTPEEIADAMRKHVPSNNEFREEFARATVSRSYLARYYLRALERQKRGDKRDAALVGDDETEKTNLEHVVPQKQSSEWPMDEETRLSLVYRIGNLCLLDKKLNSALRSAGFTKKKNTYKESSCLLTQMISRENGWGAKEIEERQTELAELAVRTWPIVA
jgi:hypothetical protein